MLKLSGTLEIGGRLSLGELVLIEEREILVRLTPLPPPFPPIPFHSDQGGPPHPPPAPGDPAGRYVWVIGSNNNGVTIGGKPVITVAGGVCVQGTLPPRPGTIIDSKGKITIKQSAVLAVGDEVKIADGINVTLTRSGQG